MDGLEFTEKVIGHVFSWPFVGAVCIAAFRKQIGHFISETSEFVIDKNGVRAKRREVSEQLEVSKRKVEDAKAAPTPVLDRLAEEHHVPSTDVQALVETSRHLNQYLDEYALAYAEAASPAVVVDRAWREVEQQLYRLTQQKEPETFTTLDGNVLFRQAVDEGLLDRKLLEAIGGLLNIHNETVTHVMNWSPTSEQASAYVSNARDVLKLMEPYMRVGYKGGKRTT